ncbi:MAG TPA: protein kinase [Thermoanaerobaculia bacterium]|nr:protein kinase [Thermoanaerobaculia bacterium]
MQGSWEPDFFVADWRVRPALGQLERGDLTVSVEARSLQVLACLARHVPNVVSKQRLIREVWGEEAFVTEEVLSHAIWELRKAFGDEARNPRFIQTIARKGYRLLVEVSFGAAPELLAAGSRIAHYEILAPVGGGAMGEVYKAKDLRLGRVVALKFLPTELARDPGARRRFLREAQAVALLDHPNVATLYEVGESEGGRVFLALAFYEGETLQQKLVSGPLPLSEAVAIARQIAQGLAAAHRRQIVHRDVKPANVVVLPDGMVKLLDFGLAKMAGATTLTHLGSSPGTPAYKSPEQTRGEKVDPRSDLWALGVVLYEMLTGRVPFGGEYEQAVIYAILNEPPRPLDGTGAFPSELAAVIERALRKDPAVRYATAEDLEKDLARIPLDGGGKITPRRPVRVRRRLRHRAVWAAVVLAVLVVFGSAVGVWQRKHRWDFGPEVTRLVEQGDRLEWRGDTEHILHNAEEAYRRALARDRDNPLIQAQLAALLARLQTQFPDADRLPEIRRLVAQSIERAPDHAMPWVAQTKLLLLEAKPREAEQAARKAVDREPDFDRGYTVLGEALIAQKRLEEGLNEIRRGVAVGQGYLRARLVLATMLQEASRYDEAAAELQQVLAYDPDHPTANQNLAGIYLDNGRNLDALPLFRKVFEMTHDARAANSLGFTYFNLDRMDEAIAAFSEAYRLDPSLHTAARNLAESYEKIGKADEAHRWYTAALSGFDRLLARGGPRAELLNGRAFCAAKLGRYSEAFGNVQEAMKLKPKQNAFLFRAAQIFAMEGRRADALTYMQRAIQEGYSREEFRRDLSFKAFRDDPRFQAILESSAKR